MFKLSIMAHVYFLDADDAIEINQSNPFAVLDPQDESLYIDDPKKALKGFFEREGMFQFNQTTRLL